MEGRVTPEPKVPASHFGSFQGFLNQKLSAHRLSKTYCDHKDNLFYVIRAKHDNAKIVRHLPMEELDVDVKTIITTNTSMKKDPNYTYIQTSKKSITPIASQHCL